MVIHPMSLGFAQTYPGVVVRGPRRATSSESTGTKERNDPVFAVPGRLPLETNLKDIRPPFVASAR
jgi:hypothetical protein